MSTIADQHTQPAVLGGPPAVSLDQADANRWPVITGDDEDAVLRVLRSGQLSISDETAGLENDYRRWLGVKHAIAHNNGTGAILAALHAFGISSFDEVIVPSATWWSTVMPIVHLGGVPVFAETCEATLGLDPAHVESLITPRTKAIVVVHLFGIPSRMDELIDIAKKRNLRILEDASHAHGATYKGKPIGTLTDAAVFSMQANKLLPSAEGGMFLTNDDALAEAVTRFGHYERLLHVQTPSRRFAATGFGYKFRMSPLSAALARSQLKKLDERNARRNDNCAFLSERLEQLGFQTFMSGPEAERVYFEFLVRYDEKRHGVPIKALAKALQAEGAMVGAPRYPLLHQQPMFTEGTWAKLARLEGSAEQPVRTYAPDALPRTVKGNGSLLKLPSFPNASRELLEQYAHAFEKVIASASKLPRENA